MPAPHTSNAMAKLLEAAKADPKKAVVLVVLVAVLGTMWLRMAMKDGGGPQGAGAATAAASDNEVLARVGTAGRGTVISATSAAALAEWRAAPVSPIVRNLFTIPLDHYAHAGGRPVAPVSRVEEGFWEELAKSLSSRADQNKQRQIRIDNAVRDAGRMQLQTIVMGASPKVVIDGEMVGEGSVVAGFRVSKIEARRIIIEREGIKLEIPMK
ncbi:MAG TPA: hypothetical protein VGR35_06530 [Tepidisphaeraceae bacterium]|nr:hypothetical protein [Tepidisphaeraceae bacterium]